MQALSFPYRDQKDVNPERVAGTCEWFLQHPKFLAWSQETTANLLWVHLMLQEISRSLESTEGKLTQHLKTIPYSVDDAYEKILRRATNPIKVKRVLHLVLVAKRPLTLKEMNIALEILDMNESDKKCTSERDLELDKE